MYVWGMWNNSDRYFQDKFPTLQVYGDSDLSEDEKGKLEDSLLLPGNPYAATKVLELFWTLKFLALTNLTAQACSFVQKSVSNICWAQYFTFIST